MFNSYVSLPKGTSNVMRCTSYKAYDRENKTNKIRCRWWLHLPNTHFGRIFISCLPRVLLWKWALRVQPFGNLLLIAFLLLSFSWFRSHTECSAIAECWKGSCLAPAMDSGCEQLTAQKVMEKVPEQLKLSR